MRLLKKCSRGFSLCSVLLLILTIVCSTVAHADSGTATIAIHSGPLMESNATNSVSLALKKKTQVASYTLSMTVTDARGTKSGWNLSITSTRFKNPADKDVNKDMLPANASHITGVSVLCGANSTCTNPVNGISYPLVIPAGTKPPPAVKFFDAAVRTGLGKFGLTMTVSVTIPSNTEPGTYTSTIIVAIANGP